MHGDQCSSTFAVLWPRLQEASDKIEVIAVDLFECKVFTLFETIGRRQKVQEVCNSVSLRSIIQLVKSVALQTELVVSARIQLEETLL